MSQKRRAKSEKHKTISQPPVEEKKPGDNVAINPQPAVASLSAAEFVQASARKHRVRANSTKHLRLVDEVGFINAFTVNYINGDIAKENIKILADVKAYLKQMKNNPYNLKDNEANAFVCNDMRHLCINGETVDNTHVKLNAKSVSTNRVTYINTILAQEIIKAEGDATKQTEMQERFDYIVNLPNRPGYGQP